MLSKKANNIGADQTVRMHRLVCAFIVRKPPKTGFLVMRPILSMAQGEMCTTLPPVVKVTTMTQTGSKAVAHRISCPSHIFCKDRPNFLQLHRIITSWAKVQNFQNPEL